MPIFAGQDISNEEFTLTVTAMSILVFSEFLCCLFCRYWQETKLKEVRYRKYEAHHILECHNNKIILTPLDQKFKSFTVTIERRDVREERICNV